MYKPPQKKNSSWTPSTVQKKGKSPSKLGHFSIQPKPNQSSESSQEIGEYSRTSMDRLAANVMRSLQTREQEIAEESTLQPKFEPPWTPTFEPPPPLPESPASKLKGAFAPVSENQIQRQCAECAKEMVEQKGEKRKDLDEIGIQTQTPHFNLKHKRLHTGSRQKIRKIKPLNIFSKNSNCFGDSWKFF